MLRRDVEGEDKVTGGPRLPRSLELFIMRIRSRCHSVVDWKLLWSKACRSGVWVQLRRGSAARVVGNLSSEGLGELSKITK